MKGGGGGGGAAKRRWRGLVVAVLGLVLLSMLVPLVFLLGIHNAFHSPLGGYSSQQRSSTSNGLRFYDREGQGNTMNQSEGDQSKHDDGLIRQLAPTRPKDFHRNSSIEAMNKTKGSYVPTAVSKPHPIANNTRAGAAGRASEHKQVIDETEKICELKYGSYCLWRQENREYMKDSIVKKMKDQLYVARAYYPSVAKLPALDKLSNELKQNIQEYERVLSESSTDTDLPPQIKKKLQKMEATITKAKVLPLDCNNIDKKLRQLVDLTEDEANFHMKQSAFLYHLAVQTTPKSLHCLSMRLTVEYFRSSSLDMEQSLADRYLNPELHHYVIFSNNVLASSVVINSTVMHARASADQVFHVLTDKQSFFAMKMWFFKNRYKEAAVQVLNFEDLVSHDHDKTYIFHPLLPEEFRVSFPGIDNQSTNHTRTEYLSVFSHSQYALPKIFHTLKKVVVLDEDVVVQRDLSGLWSIELNGKVNGAVQTCTVRFSELKHFLSENNDGVNFCAWMSGVNVVDLVRWRELDVTRTFKRLVNEATKEDGISEEAVILHASLLTFRGLVHVLDDTWMLSGLGHNYGLDDESIKKAAVLHFNGNMKPWLELGIANYRGYWRKYLNRENQLLSDCNVNS